MIKSNCFLLSFVTTIKKKRKEPCLIIGVIRNQRLTLRLSPINQRQELLCNFAYPNKLYILQLSGTKEPLDSSCFRLRQYNHKLIFLMDTRLGDHGIDWLKQQFNLFSIGVVSIGYSSGLALLWEKDVCATIQNYLKIVLMQV